MATMAPMTTEDMKYMFHHVFLPPKLPGEGKDSNKKAKDHALLSRLNDDMVAFYGCVEVPEVPSISDALPAVRNLRTLIDPAQPALEEVLQRELSHLSTRGGIVPVYIAAQNAGLIIRCQDHKVVFETFELLPPNSIVMKTKGRIKRYFPGNSVAIDKTTFNDSEFRRTLCQTIAKMSGQSVPEMLSKATKAGTDHIEDRDTTNPAVVTEFLTAYLLAVGQPFQPHLLQKNTREEVMWSNARLPWHRSPVWLLARVAMQTAFHRTSSCTTNDLYKEFMIFFMGRVLHDAIHTQGVNIESDVLHCMICKISRRITKLAKTYGDSRLSARKWFRTVTDSLAKAEDLLKKRQQSISKLSDPNVPMSALSSLDFDADTPAELHDLDTYIHMIMDPPDVTAKTEFRPPPMVARLPAETLPIEVIPDVIHSKKQELHHLAAFESWVEHHLANWVDRYIFQPETCGCITELLLDYHKKASAQYGTNPENTSLMILTCLELWMACDRSATAIHPLLLEYNPGIPIEIGQSLLLPLKSQMERLCYIEMYVEDRLRQAQPEHPNILTSFGTANSFPVRYFAQSSRHQQLFDKIVHDATEKKAAKLREYHKMKARYSTLMAEHGRLSCTYISSEYGTSEHSPGCQKCSCASQANSLTIVVFEWPLPKMNSCAQSTVFELDRPQAFGKWRDATTYLLMDVFVCKYEPSNTPSCEYEPNSCLGDYEQTAPLRMRLLSESKPAIVTHRSTYKIQDATPETICVNNGLQYRYFDTFSGVFAAKQVVTSRVPRMCMYTLPQSLSVLQDFLYRPYSQPNGPDPNVVISRLSSCPTSMSLEEFKALASIPYGTRTQWSNILVQLALPSVDFKKIETYLVILQTIHQAGPPCSSPMEIKTAREGHQDLLGGSFSKKLMDCLQDALGRIRENWESYQSLAGFVVIANRLDNMAVFHGSGGFVEDCRQTALKWVRTLRDRARDAAHSKDRTEFLGRMFELALIGASTFESDEKGLRHNLAKPHAAANLLEFYISIEETSHSGYNAKDKLLTMAYQRWVRLTSRALPILLDLIVTQRSTCLDDVILNVWADYQKGTHWRSCPSAEHWLTSESISKKLAGSPKQSVHYNLLTGELLVDGLPLSRLPDEYGSQTLYVQIFGKTTVEVMPTARPGMKFTSIRLIKGHQVYFGMDNNMEMNLTTVKGNDTWDLIPRRILQDKVPSHFLDDFTHWYHRNTKTVTFRPLKSPWVSSPSFWRLHKLLPSGNATSRWKMKQDNNDLVIDRASATAREMARIFSPVENISHLHLIFDHEKIILKVELPRLKIQFSMFPHIPRLNSRECRGMYLDTCTQTRTLVGLASKLVLTNKAGKRVILIPSGDVIWQRQDGHVSVQAVLGTCNMVHHYSIDEQLGRLVDKGSVQSKLYLCFLHALTSYCLPDELTNRTGTERALEILSETDIPSAARLTQESVDLLHKIAMLAPQRRFYPAHLCVMQDVSWDKQLSFLSQRAELYLRARALLDDAARREFFHQGKEILIGLDKFSDDDTSLLGRDAIRASTFYRSGFGGDLFTVQHDSVYTTRPNASLQLSDRQMAVVSAASRVMHNTDTLQYTNDANFPDRLWNLFKNADVLGLTSAMTIPIKYDAELLVDTADKMGSNWCLLHESLKNKASTKFDFAMFIATLAFSKGVDLVAIQALCSMYTNAGVGNVRIPRADNFKLSLGRNVPQSTVYTLIDNNAKAYSGSRGAQMTKSEAKNCRKRFSRRKRVASDVFVQEMVAQWPCPCPKSPVDKSITEYINVERAMTGVRASFKSFWENRSFYLYLEELGQAISSVPCQRMSAPVVEQLLPVAEPPKPKAFTTADDLFRLGVPAIPIPVTVTANISVQEVQTQTDSSALCGLTALSDRLASMANQPFKAAYVKDFRKSIDCIQTQPSGKTALPCLGDTKYFHSMQAEAEEWQRITYTALINSVINSLPVYQRYNAPRPSQLFFLAQLSHKQWHRRSLTWKKAIVAFGCAVAEVQRATRLVTVCSNAGDLARELANAGHTNWDPLAEPEILLQEVMSGLLIREVQIDIAKMMANPPGGHNSAMQLNMGEGKSSVIVPIVAASLADGNRLAMVVVGKPQSKQMLHMLVCKLGGLSGRRIYHMPFSRSLVLREEHYNEINKLCHECKDTGGIMLVQPEHLLSFQLASPEMAIRGEANMSASALETRRFLNDHSCYIVDESDENFSVKFELIYTMGTPSNVELSPERWVLIQAVLEIVQEVAPLVKEELPLSIEIEQGSVPGSFPRIRFLRDDGRDQVCKRVAERVCENGLPGVPIGRQSPAIRKAIEKYITETKPSQDVVTAVESCQAFWTESVKPRVHLLRGLLGRGVLGFAFGSKRWRVNYGVDITRQPPKRLAVPFRAKDSPAPQSEFSHPDVVIMLTCLSYYYGGLSHEDLFRSFEKLALSDQASSEYSDWVHSASADMPAAFHNLSGVNVKDRHQCQEQVFPHLQRSKGAIDYFLSNIVFPKEMNEFPQKLSASGWDIGQVKAHPTTGFSGTSDSQHLLPLSVRHLDLPEQRHTNALVLQHLLQPENTVVYMPDVQQPHPKLSSNAASDAERLLHLIVDAQPPVQVILDAGAQILELTNVQMAKNWLLLDRRHKEAVVFCGDNDEIMIIDRSGHAEAFQTSPFAQQLDRCLVFLDEAHTRGIDLKLPQDYRAAVTLGANLTKDRLVQACMRMRMLGKGQSIAFYVPKEIQDKIALIPGCSSVEGERCTVSDVLIWTISETWADLSRSMPLWAVQGARFVRQKQVWAEAHETAGLTQDRANKLLEKEAMSLADHYKPKTSVEAKVTDAASAVGYMRSVLGESEEDIPQSALPELETIVERCRQFDAHQHASTSALHEEQERELSPEIEEEKHVERPHALEPAKHSVHRDILGFVVTGRLPKKSIHVFEAASLVAKGGISHIPAFVSLSNTSAAEHLDVTQFPLENCLFVSADFARTVKLPVGGAVNYSDFFLRPVQWILTLRNADAGASIAKMIIISPYEAQELMPAIKEARSRVYLHLYAPRSSQSVAPIDHLQLYTVPKPNPYLTIPGLGPTSEFDHDATSSFSVQLNLFAGQLYFASMAEYKSACRYLGLASEASTDDRTVVSADGFILAGNGKSPHFENSPAAFLGVYLSKIRWNCDTISRTHWGKVLGGQFVTASDIAGPKRDGFVVALEDGQTKPRPATDTAMKDV